MVRIGRWPFRSWSRMSVAFVLLAAALLAASLHRHFSAQHMEVSSATLEVVPLGNVDPHLAAVIAERVAAIYGIPRQVTAKPVSLPPEAYDAALGQYNADRLLVYLKRRSRPPRTHLLAITSADITSAHKHFLFGLADGPGRVAVMSLYRLRPETGENRAVLLRDRAVKIAVHELGHTLGFQHCLDERCVMHYSDTAAGLDRTRSTLCAHCASRLR